MKSIRLMSGLLVLCAACVCSAVVVSAAVKEPKDAKCPVSGKGCNPDKSVAFDGGKVWFCCGNCEAAFNGNPTKFAAKAHQQQVSTGQLVQKGCPFSGGAVKPETVIDIGGASVGFCCNNCKGKVEKAGGDEQIEMVFGSVEKGFAPAGK
jgi:YHS domain-containing protein